MQDGLLELAAGCFALAIMASLAERRRNRRAVLEQVGWVPWSGLTVGLLFVALAALVVGLKS